LPIRAFVLVNTLPGTSEQVVNARTVRGVKMANSVFGRFDAVVVIEAKDMKELKSTIYEMLEKLPNVVHTETLAALYVPE